MSAVAGVITQSFGHHEMGTITQSKVSGSMSETGNTTYSDLTVDSTVVTVDNTIITADNT
jgi:hypothetical protein